jgi:hypothetical protein
MPEGHTGDFMRLQLVFADNGQGPGVGGVMGPIIPVVKIIVGEDHGTVIPAQRAPADIIIVVIPVDPTGPPVISGNPVPAHSHSPMPSPIVASHPTPGLISDPVPAAVVVPDPPSVIVGPPILIINDRNPDISVRPFINPVAVIGELGFIVLKLRRQIAFRDILILQRIAVLVPVVKIILIIR